MQPPVVAQRAAYARAGYGAGHRVGLLLDTRPAFFLHWFALNGLGVSVVPINADLRAAELEYLVGHSEIALAVALTHRHVDLSVAARAAGRPLVLMAGDGLEVVDPVPPAPFGSPDGTAAPTLATECALLYTSGTTGRPKGCILPNRYFLHSGAWYAAVGGLAALRMAHPDGQGGWTQERMLTPLPLVHMNAMAYSTLAMVLTGGCLVVLDRFHPGTWWDSVRASRASVVHYLGVMPSMLMKAAPRADDRGHAVRFGFGAGVDRALHAPFEARFGFPLLEARAMTETGAGAVVMAHCDPRQVGSNCFGREGPDVEVRLVADHGGEAGLDEPGELWVRHTGPDPRDGFFAGYLKDPEATSEAWAEGWFHTGDIVRRDADGQLHFIDRRKNVIRRSGENIAAVEVEAVRGYKDEAAFVQAVAELSEDERTKRRGGDLGWFSAERMPVDFVEAVRGMSVGVPAPVVKTRLGWHWVRVKARQPARVPAFEEVKEEIRAALEGERRELAVKALMGELRLRSVKPTRFLHVFDAVVEGVEAAGERKKEGGK
jgi:acyl-CoA synthetase (AMP-forming)/AMP-acid ligase II